MEPGAVEQFTILGLIGGVVVAGLAKQWVFGWTYAAKVTDLERMEEDRNFWRDTALQAMGHTDKALTAVVRKRAGGG